MEAAEFLLDRGADIDGFAGEFHRYDHGSTPLHKTVMTNQLEMARLLLARGANSLVGDRAYDTTPYGWTYYLDTSKALDELLKEHHEAAVKKAGTRTEEEKPNGVNAPIEPLSVLLSLSLATAVFAGEVDWPYYGADQGGKRYTPADQIDRDNFDQLRVVWRYRPRDQQIYETARANRSQERGRSRRGRRGGLSFSNNRGTPLAVNGVLYYGSPYNILSAVDGQSGEELWAFDPESWKGSSFFVGNSRGVSYWTDGEVERIFLATATAYLYSIDAKTGLPDPNFGEDGRVDLGALLRRAAE